MGVSIWESSLFFSPRSVSSFMSASWLHAEVRAAITTRTAATILPQARRDRAAALVLVRELAREALAQLDLVQVVEAPAALVGRAPALFHTPMLRPPVQSLDTE